MHKNGGQKENFLFDNFDANWSSTLDNLTGALWVFVILKIKETPIQGCLFFELERWKFLAKTIVVDNAARVRGRGPVRAWSSDPVSGKLGRRRLSGVVGRVAGARRVSCRSSFDGKRGSLTLEVAQDPVVKVLGVDRRGELGRCGAQAEATRSQSQ